MANTAQETTKPKRTQTTAMKQVVKRQPSFGEKAHKVHDMSSEVVPPKRIRRGCCTFLFPYRGSGCCFVLLLCLILIFILRAYTNDWNPIVSGLVGPFFALDLQQDIKHSLKSGNWDRIRSGYESHWFLDHSVALIGSSSTEYDGGFVGWRGDVEEVAVEIDRKLPLASGSKLISGSVIYSVINHPNTSLTKDSRPDEYFDFWKCNSATDLLCTNITVEKLLSFRSGIVNDHCTRSELANVSWEDCVELMYLKEYDEDRFDTFEYGPVGLTIAGLMALKEMRKLPGYENVTWDDIMKELVLDKAGIDVNAPEWDDKFYDNGRMTYDYSFTHHSKTNYNPNFPDLSASLGCSPRQYAQFLHAFISRKLFGADIIKQMTKNHGDCPPFFGLDLEPYQGYSQTSWYAGRNITHSLGYYGFFPWIDQSDPDPSYHFYGVVAVNYRVQTAWMMKVITTYCAPLILIGMFCCVVCCQTRKKNDIGSKILDEPSTPVNKEKDEPVKTDGLYAIV